MGTPNVSKSHRPGLFTVRSAPYLFDIPRMKYSAVGIEKMLHGSFYADWADDRKPGDKHVLHKAQHDVSFPLYDALPLESAQVKDYFASPIIGPGLGFSFAKDTTSEQDYCNVPEAHYTQGLLILLEREERMI